MARSVLCHGFELALGGVQGFELLGVFGPLVVGQGLALGKKHRLRWFTKENSERDKQATLWPNSVGKRQHTHTQNKTRHVRKWSHNKPYSWLRQISTIIGGRCFGLLAILDERKTNPDNWFLGLL